MKLVSYAERPDLLARRDELGAVWDEFMYHDAVADVHWNRQYEEFPDLQLFLLDEDDRLLAESNAVPIPFGPDELPDDGWDAALEQATADGREGRVGDRDHDRRRAARQGPEPDDARRDARRRRRARALRISSRPCARARSTSIRWRRWSATSSGAATTASSSTPGCARTSRRGRSWSRSRRPRCGSRGSVGDWESWTGLRFPDSGSYVVPGALVPVEIDRERDEGVYVEPNVWMHHRL